MNLSSIKVNDSNIIGVDNEPTAGSDNLVKSGGVRKFLTGFTISDITLTKNEDNTYRLISGAKGSSQIFALSTPIHLNKGETISVRESGDMTLSNVAFLSLVNSDGTFISLIYAGGEPNARREYFANEECYVEVCNRKSSMESHIRITCLIKSYLENNIDNIDNACKTLSNTLSTNVSKIYKTMIDSIPSWNGATSYKVGDVVKRNDILYKCKTAIQNANFLPAYWDEISVTTLINDVKTIANTNTGKLLGFSRHDITLSVGHSASYRHTNGSIVSFAATYVSSPVHLNKGDVFSISLDSSLTSSFSSLSLVSENGDFIKTIYNGSVSGRVYYIAAEDCYVEAVKYNGSTGAVILRSYIIDYVIKELGKLYSSIANVESSLLGVKQKFEYEIDITSSTEDRFYNASNISIGSTYTGTLASSTVFECQKISVKAGDRYHINTYDNTSSARAYILTNSSDIVLSLGANSGSTNMILQIEQNGTLYLSSWKDKGFSVIKIIDVIKELENGIQDSNDRIDATNINLAYEKSKRHSALLEHLYNPTVTTKIKLFGDSVTHG